MGEEQLRDPKHRTSEANRRVQLVNIGKKSCFGHATVSWDDDFFALMLDKRVRFFSEGRYDFGGLCADEMNIKNLHAELARVGIASRVDQTDGYYHTRARHSACGDGAGGSS